MKGDPGARGQGGGPKTYPPPFLHTPHLVCVLCTCLAWGRPQSLCPPPFSTPCWRPLHPPCSASGPPARPVPGGGENAREGITLIHTAAGGKGECQRTIWYGRGGGWEEGGGRLQILERKEWGAEGGLTSTSTPCRSWRGRRAGRSHLQLRDACEECRLLCVEAGGVAFSRA